MGDLDNEGRFINDTIALYSRIFVKEGPHPKYWNQMSDLEKFDFKRNVTSEMASPSSGNGLFRKLVAITCELER